MARIHFQFFILLSMFSLSLSSWAKTLEWDPAEAKKLQFSQTCSQFSKPNCKIIPEFLKTQKRLCEIQRAALNCEKFEKEKFDDSWKYIQCNFERMCFDNTVNPLDTAAACVVGATSIFVDVAALGKQILSGAASRIVQKSEWLKECDKSLDCKKKLAGSQPSTQYLLNSNKLDELNKISAAYLMARKVDYDSIRVQMMIHGSISKQQYYQEIGWVVPATNKLSQLPVDQAINLSSIWELIKSKLDSETNEVSCYVPIEKTRLKCQILSDVLGGFTLEKAFALRLKKIGSLALKATFEKVDLRLSGQLKRIAEASEVKKEFVATFAQKNLTTQLENEAWLEKISHPSPTQRTLTIENANLKNMNDKIFKDEEYVTALTNAYKEMQFSKLKILEKELQIKNPEFKFTAFSDFKSLRMVYEESPGVDVTSLLKKLTEETNSEFAEYTLKNKLVRQADQPGSWFKAAVNTSDDLTNITAKYARLGNSESLFVDGVHDPGFKRWAQTQFNEGRQLRAELIESLKETTLVTSKNLNEANLHQDVFEILRKNKSDPELSKMLIEKKFGLAPLSDKTFSKLADYFEKVDSFSPGLRNTERQFATLSEASHGGLSIDMIGLGSEHLQATSADAFAKSKSLDELLLNSRSAEVALTEKIQMRKNELEAKFKSITGDRNAKVICSGDGCKAFIENREISETEVKRFADAVTQDGEQGRLRFSEVKKLESKNYQDLVAKQGEDLEKNLRQSLIGKIDQKRLEGINFTVQIRAAKPGEGTAKLHISEASGLRLSPQEKKIVEETYRNSLKNSNTGYK